MSGVGDVVLEARGISKAFGGVQALDDVDFHVGGAETVALVGDNGAGKSTLVKILSGVEQADSGSVSLKGQKVEIRNPLHARELGIETVYQDLALADNLDVTANMFMGRELVHRILGWNTPFLDFRGMERATAQTLEGLGINVTSPRQRVATMSGGQRQAIAVGRAVRWAADLVLMDEPTAALGVKEAARVLELIRQLCQKGIAIVVISHNLQHVFDIAQRIVVVRQGRVVGSVLRETTSVQEIVELITGGLRERLGQE